MLDFERWGFRRRRLDRLRDFGRMLGEGKRLADRFGQRLAAGFPEGGHFFELGFGSPETDLDRLQKIRLQFHVVQGEVALDGFAHDALGQHDVIVPEAQGGLHALKERKHGGGQFVSLLAGHLKGVAERFAGNAKLVRVVSSLAGQVLGLLDEGIELQMDRLGEKLLDGIAGLLDFVAHAPPGAEAAEHPGRRGVFAG